MNWNLCVIFTSQSSNPCQHMHHCHDWGSTDKGRFAPHSAPAPWAKSLVFENAQAKRNFPCFVGLHRRILETACLNIHSSPWKIYRVNMNFWANWTFPSWRMGVIKIIPLRKSHMAENYLQCMYLLVSAGGPWCSCDEAWLLRHILNQMVSMRRQDSIAL